MEISTHIAVVQIDEIRWYNVGAWFAVMLSRGLVEMGGQVVFVAKGNLPPGVEAGKTGIAVRNDFTFSAPRFLFEAKKLANIVTEIDADVICAHRAGGMNLALAARAMLPAPGPVIVRARYDAREVKSGVGNRLIYRPIDGILAPNRNIVDRHIDKLGIPSDRIKILPGGVDVDLFKPDESAPDVREEWGIPDDAPLIGLVGRLDYVKGHDHFIETAALVAENFPRAYFAIIGKEVNITIEELKIHAARKGILGKLIFVGERPDVARCVAALDVGVITSTGSEALSRVALEYMACGIPVVATNIGGIPEVVEDGAVGFVVPAADASAMAESINKLLSNPDEAKQMGIEGRKRAESMYSPEEIARQGTDFFMQLIERRNAKANKR